MQPRAVWPEDPIFIEIGVKDVELASSLRQEGYSKYLGVGTNSRRVAKLQANHPQLADQLTYAKRHKLVLNNNAEVLILSGMKMIYLWSFRSVRHAQSVAWRFGFSPLSLVAVLGCLCQMLFKRCSWPRVVTFRVAGGKPRRLFVSRILRQKYCHSNSLHFIPHGPGVRGLFRQFDQQGVRYVVLRWFDALPEIEPSKDVDMLIDDRSLSQALTILHALPGIQPCDVYSETGLARSEYCGTPYYPPRLARRILDGAIRHKDLCTIPNPWDYFHSLAYHAVYHKGVRSGLPRGETGLRSKGKPRHDYIGTLRNMADQLGIDVTIGLKELHAYLQENNWGPSPKFLSRLAAACPRNRWLRLLSQRLEPEIHDQGLAVFVMRKNAVQLGFQDKMIAMIEEGGFAILGTKVLPPYQVEYAADRTRGGNWDEGPGNCPGGPPAVAVVAYDPNPLPPNRKQRRRFPQRTNARIFVKETIRYAVLAALPRHQGCNALHSSDHAAEAWHLIEVFAPEMEEEIRARLHQFRQPAPTLQFRQPAAVLPMLRRAA